MTPGVLKFDLSDVEPGQDFDTPIPKGVYKMKILDIKDEPSKSDGRPMYTVELEVIKGEWKGRRLWDYIKYEDDSSQWKLAQLLEALGVIGKEGKRKGSFNPAKFEGKVVVVRVKHESNEDYNDGEPTAKVGSMQPLPEDEPEEEGEAEAEATPAAEEGEEEVTAADVREMDLKELKEFAEEQELTDIKFTKRSKVETKADEIIEALELADEVIEDPEDWDTLAEMGEDDLVAYIEQEELEVDTEQEEDDLRKSLAEELEIEVPEDAAGGEAADYDSMSVKDLKATCSERGLSTKGGKKGMVKRLTEDDAKTSSGSDGDPF